MEKLTRELVESHLMSCIDIHSEEQRDGKIRFAWELTKRLAPQDEIEETEWEYKFTSHETARNFAFGWIRKNRPDLEKAAKNEALEGIRYRALKA